MHQLVYTSVARPELTSADLFHIIERSARNNPSCDITGFLLVRDGTFLQYVEGPLMALDDLLGRLEKDPRHHSIRVVHRAPAQVRAFPNWRMKRLSNSDDALRELETAWQGQSAGLPSAVRTFLAERRAA